MGGGTMKEAPVAGGAWDAPTQPAPRKATRVTLMDVFIVALRYITERSLIALSKKQTGDITTNKYDPLDSESHVPA